MLVLKLTKTVNIDIWNIWHMTFTGAITMQSRNFAIGIGDSVVHAIIAYKFSRSLYTCEDYFELDGITASWNRNMDGTICICN